MIGIAFTLALLGLLALGPRLFVVVGAATATSFLLFTDYGDPIVQLDRIATKMESLTTKNVFLSIPFFIAAGSIMTRGGIAKRLTDLARALVGWLPGGLAVASIIACIVFAAISGSSPVTLVAVGAVMFPALIDSGYPRRFAIGIITSAGSLGCMIPPAITMLIYAICVQGRSGEVNPADLFLAGLLPALFIAGLLSLYSVVIGLQVPGSRQPFAATELLHAGREAAWSLTLPAIVLGGIYGGVFTPTEAGAVAFAASAVIACVVHADVSLRQLPGLLVEAASLIGSLVLIVVLAFGLNDFLVEVDAAGVIQSWVEEGALSSWEFMLLVNAVLIVIGALMDSISATLVFAPILAPVAIDLYGIDPIHFGVVFVVNMEIGYIAPPVATNLFVAAAIFRQPFAEVAKAILPTLGIICAALVALIYVPTLSTGVLNWRDGREIVETFPWEPPAATGSATEAPPDPTGGAPRVMTMQEMMKASQNAAAGAAAPDPAAPPKVMTMQEMMKAAQDAAAKEAPPAADPSATPDATTAPTPAPPAP